MDMNDLTDVFENPVVQCKGDYIKDGLLYCGKCDTPKQTKITVGGHVWTPSCMCQCEADRYHAYQDKMQRKEALDSVRRLRQMGFADAEMKRMTFDHDDHANEKLSQIARQYVDMFAQMRMRGKGLLLYGSVGTGKTFISACIANALIDRGHPCLVTNFSRLTNTLQGMHDRQTWIDGLNRFDLLVIDDLASERETSYMSEIVQSVIDARYRTGKPLIITTNLTADELKHPDDVRKQRIYSRLFEMCIPYECKGQDRRKNTLREDFVTYGGMLGIWKGGQDD